MQELKNSAFTGEVCSSMTNSELSKLVSHLWPVNQDGLTEIAYSYDRSHIRAQKIERYLQEYPGTKFFPVSNNLKYLIAKVLKYWQQGCQNLIKFTFHETAPENFKGILFQECEYAKDSNILGTSSRDNSLQEKVRGYPKANKNIICLSKVNKARDIRTISHEIGHAIGLNHYHDSKLLSERLIESPQGQGCSVMPYPHLIESNKNTCINKKSCSGEPYAIYPGEMDLDVCQRIYNPNHSFFTTKAIKAKRMRGYQKNMTKFEDKNLSSILLFFIFICWVMKNLVCRATHKMHFQSA